MGVRTNHANRMAVNNRSSPHLLQAVQQLQHQRLSQPSQTQTLAQFTPATVRSDIDDTAAEDLADGRGHESDSFDEDEEQKYINKSETIQLECNHHTIQVELAIISAVATTPEEHQEMKKNHCWIKLPNAHLPDITIDTAVWMWEDAQITICF